MSRIGKQPIKIPAAVKVAVNGQNVSVEGPKGKMSWDVPARAKPELKDGEIIVIRENDERQSRAIHGLSRSLLSNMVQGCCEGFVRELEIEGVGYKAELKGKEIALSLGFSHVINYPIPPNITVTLDGQTKVKIEGADKQKVGQVASEIRAFSPAEPYKGKGVKYKGERVRRKEGKTVQ
ncbi:MAG: 50S ribosomal protein L6 [Verrucomicrobiia bacterium]|jgi:large subunit ribosomal protein L6|tara:strand:- start:66 stop:602 length:537 start_codon:yes stop_codon:yes gene_type:complete